MKKRFLTLILAATVVTTHTWADVITLGAGNVSCGTWLENRKIGTWYDLSQWILGYHTATQDISRIKLDTDADAINFFIDKYCSENPLNDLLHASRELVLALKK